MNFMKILLVSWLMTSNIHALSSQQVENIILHTIAYAEGTTTDDVKPFGFSSEYDVTFNYGKYAPKDTRLTKLTISQVRVLRNQMIRSQRLHKCRYRSTAMGKFGFTKDNFEKFVKKFSLEDDQRFTQYIQNLFATQQIKDIGLDAFLNGRISVSHYQRNLAKKWASLPDPKTGKSRYNQPIGIDNERLRNILIQLKSSYNKTNH